MKSKFRKLLVGGPKSINVGPQLFAQSLRDQGALVIQVDWKPVAGGDPEMMGLLSKLL